MDILWAVIAIVISTFCYYICDFFYGSGRYWKNRGIPTLANAVPLIGHMWPVVTAREGFIYMYNMLYNKMSTSMFGIYNFRQPVLIVRDPDIIKTILLNSFSNFEENASKLDPQLDPLLSTNAFYTAGDTWRSQRRIFHSALTNKQLKVVALQINEVCLKFNNYITTHVEKNGGKIVVDAQHLFSHFTAEVVAIAAFGIDGRSFTDDPQSFRRIAGKMFEPSKFNEFIGSIALFFPILRRLVGISFMPTSVDRHFRKILKEVVASRAQSNEAGNDFLQQIIDVYNAEIGKEDEDFIAGHASAFFLDGYITSSITIGFVSYFLAKHEDVQQKVRSEAQTIFDKYEGRMTFEALGEMKYLEQVIHEAMRLFPALGYIGKICTESCKLVGSDGLECHVERGTEIIIPAIELHRDPRFWNAPDEFDPDRFQGNDFNKFAFVPFGAGPRMCLGRRVAMMQMKAALATLVRCYQLAVNGRMKEPIAVNTMCTIFTIPEDKIWIDIKALSATSEPL